jgi:hypothetical protein
MTLPNDALMADLRAFTPTGNEYADVERLREIMERWQREPEAVRLSALPLVFGIFERNPDSTELGVPGPVVHSLEAAGGYEHQLPRSLRRCPSYYTLWMVNRILNALGTSDRERAPWIGLLREVLENPNAPQPVKETAERFLRKQQA